MRDFCLLAHLGVIGREAGVGENILTVPASWHALTAVFSADLGQKCSILSILDKAGGQIGQTVGADSLEGLLDRDRLSLAVVGVGAGQESEGEFNKLMAFVPSLRRKHQHCQVILVTSRKLSLQKSCKAILNNVSAIVDYESSEFPDRITEHFQLCRDHFTELLCRDSFNSATAASEIDPEVGLVGNSLTLRQVVFESRRAARISDAPVIIYGESGTGKQRLAEYIHRLDPKRNRRSFICVNCAAIAGTLAESELFGHRKGAFTGATEDRLGYFRAADGGTILLDEISELCLSLQPKILRVVQEGLVLPVGSDKEYRVDVRILCATNRNLLEMVNINAFRLDLYQRLNVIQLNVPPLRDRTEDIPELFETFLQKYQHYCPCEITSVDSEVYDVLARALGPGNIRELENVVRQILAFKVNGNRITISDLSKQTVTAGLKLSENDKQNIKIDINIPDDTINALANGSKRLSEAVAEFESMMLARLLKRVDSHTTLADRLGITRRTLYNKLERYNLR